MPLSASAPQISENMGQIERTIIHHSHGWMDGWMVSGGQETVFCWISSS